MMFMERFMYLQANILTYRSIARTMELASLMSQLSAHFYAKHVSSTNVGSGDCESVQYDRHRYIVPDS